MSPKQRQSIPCIDPHDDGGRAIYTLTDARTGETQDVTVCMKHGEEMPLIDGDLVRARPADTGAMCDFTPIGTRTLTAEEIADRDRGFTAPNSRTRQPIPSWYGEFEDE